MDVLHKLGYLLIVITVLYCAVGHICSWLTIVL